MRNKKSGPRREQAEPGGLERLAFLSVCALFVILTGVNGYTRSELARIDGNLRDTRAMVERQEAWRAEAEERWAASAEAPEAPAAPEEAPEAPEPESRYGPITGEEREILARVVYLEARGECAEGRQAVAEVVLNRVQSDAFPDTVAEVVFQPGQFSTADDLADAEPGENEYAAVDGALDGPAALPEGVVYFSRSPQNDRIFGQIGNHWFCYQ